MDQTNAQERLPLIGFRFWLLVFFQNIYSRLVNRWMKTFRSEKYLNTNKLYKLKLVGVRSTNSYPFSRAVFQAVKVAFGRFTNKLAIARTVKCSWQLGGVRTMLWKTIDA